MKITFNEINDVIDGKILSRGEEVDYKGVETDTRRLEENYIFFGLKGARVDGNDLVLQAVESGAALCIIDKQGKNLEEVTEKAGVIIVEDSRKALYKLAEYYRKKFKIEVVGITGSTGKTSTKDILSGMLSEKKKVFKTIGNFNSDIGLPIMIFKLKDEYDVAVLEMGMSGFGEIDLLAKMAKPHMSIITNIGDSHLEQLKTRDNILKAKMEISNYYDQDDLLIVNNNDSRLAKVQNKDFRILKCGIESHGDCDVQVVKSDYESIEFKVLKGAYEGQSFKLNMPGEHNVSNAVLCLQVCNELGLSGEEVRMGLDRIEKTSMRMDVMRNEELQVTVVNDCYNASPDSMRAAIGVTSTMEGRTLCVLGTMKELGEGSRALHREVGEYAKEKGVSDIYVFGEFSHEYVNGFGKGKEFSSKEELCEQLKSDMKEGDVIMVKASRSLRFETVVEELLR